MAKTISDWLDVLRASTDADQGDALVGRLVAETDEIHDLRTLLAGISADARIADAHVSALSERSLVAADRACDVWGFRDVATARRERLRDLEGARAALETGFRCFSKPRADVRARAAAAIALVHETRGYEWALLADGFVETLGDIAGARRCLEAGLERARANAHADDLVSIAGAWHKHLDRETALALVREAEAIEGPTRAGRWGLANAWRAADEPGEAARVLASALADAVSVREALDVALACASHGQLDRAREALERAPRFAKDAGDWLSIAEAAFDLHLESAVVRHALDSARGLADEGSRQAIARGYGLWLGDEAAAAALGPLGVEPDALGEPRRAPAGFDASASALLDWLRAKITPERLIAIAHADYGSDAEKHAAALRDICVHGRLPAPLGWVPGEVLQLTRWTQGEGTDHVTRAFACTVLCLTPGGIDSLSDNGIILLESCRALGGEALDGCERLLAWCAATRPEVPAEHEAYDEPEARIALLLLFLSCAGRNANDPRLDGLERQLGDVSVLRPFTEQSMRAGLWREMRALCLVPGRAQPAIGRVLAALDLRA